MVLPATTLMAAVLIFLILARFSNNISLALENDVLPQHHHIEQPLQNKSCRVILNEKVNVDDPQRVVQIPGTGW